MESFSSVKEGRYIRQGIRAFSNTEPRPVRLRNWGWHFMRNIRRRVQPEAFSRGVESSIRVRSGGIRRAQLVWRDDSWGT